MVTKAFLLCFLFSWSYTAACAKMFFFSLLCADMRRLCSATILSLCSVSKKSLAQLLSHSCSRHMSCHLDWPPQPVCWFLDCTPVYLLWGMFPVNLSNKQSRWTVRGSINSFESKYLFYTVTYFRRFLHVCMASFPGLLSVLVWTHTRRLLGKCIPLLHWQQM